MLHIGLTGGIGSGKSTVANMFAELGTPIIDSDKIARQLTQIGSPYLEKIRNKFGDTYFNEDGSLDRRRLREYVFSNSGANKWLGKLLHPTILDTMQKQASKYSTPYCIIVIPLLAELEGVPFIDRVCVIDAPESIQISRACQRDQCGPAAIKSLMNHQVSREKRLKYADDTITNDRDIPSLRKQVASLHEAYLTIAKD